MTDIEEYLHKKHTGLKVIPSQWLKHELQCSWKEEAEAKKLVAELLGQNKCPKFIPKDVFAFAISCFI